MQGWLCTPGQTSTWNTPPQTICSTLQMYWVWMCCVCSQANNNMSGKAMSSARDLGQQAAVAGSGLPGSTWSSQGGFPTATSAKGHGGTATWRTGATIAGVCTQSRGSGCLTVASEVKASKDTLQGPAKGLEAPGQAPGL